MPWSPYGDDRPTATSTFSSEPGRTSAPPRSSRMASWIGPSSGSRRRAADALARRRSSIHRGARGATVVGADVGTHPRRPGRGSDPGGSRGWPVQRHPSAAEDRPKPDLVPAPESITDGDRITRGHNARAPGRTRNPRGGVRHEPGDGRARSHQRRCRDGRSNPSRNGPGFADAERQPLRSGVLPAHRVGRSCADPRWRRRAAGQRDDRCRPRTRLHRRKRDSPRLLHEPGRGRHAVVTARGPGRVPLGRRVRQPARDHRGRPGRRNVEPPPHSGDRTRRGQLVRPARLGSRRIGHCLHMAAGHATTRRRPRSGRPRTTRTCMSCRSMVHPRASWGTSTTAR